jgi:hypothetical protein
MTRDFVQQNWALIAASVLFVTIALFVLYRLLQDSRRGRLAAALGHLRERERALEAATRSVSKAGKRLQKLQAKGDSVPPGQVLAAKDALAEAKETERLLTEQVQVVGNQARMVILEDYPTKDHDAMRRKYLRETK